jgi:hypothetical protein
MSFIRQFIEFGKDDRADRNLKFAVIFLILWLVGGFSILGLYALTQEGWTRGVSMFSHEALLSLAFGALGSLVGFLFGIPRRLRKSDTGSKRNGTNKDSTTAEHRKPRNTLVKTNLEEVSDWLTKIILGAGLTQLIGLPTKMKQLGEYLAPRFENDALLPISIVMNSVVFGFFTGYVLTQLFLVTALKEAEAPGDGA